MNRLIFSRFLSANATVIDKALLRKLRSDTGLPFIKIKEALIHNNNDSDKTKSWLLEKAEENNWAKAQKLSQRATVQGMVGIYNLRGSDFVSMVSMQCETEFVSKNAKFVDLLYKSSMALQAIESNGEVPAEDALSFTFDDQKISDLLLSTIGSVGENIKPNRFYTHKLKSDKQKIVSYIHRESDCGYENLSLGSIGSSIIFEDLEDESLGMTIAQHLAGSEIDQPLHQDQPLLQDESVTIGELCKRHNFKIIDYFRMCSH